MGWGKLVIITADMRWGKIVLNSLNKTGWMVGNYIADKKIRIVLQNGYSLNCWYFEWYIMKVSSMILCRLLFQDVDECTSNSHNCHSQATCTNTIGSFFCTCNSGWTGSGQNCKGMYPQASLKTVIWGRWTFPCFDFRK